MADFSDTMALQRQLMSLTMFDTPSWLWCRMVIAVGVDDDVKGCESDPLFKTARHQLASLRTLRSEGRCAILSQNDTASI